MSGKDDAPQAARTIQYIREQQGVGVSVQDDSLPGGLLPQMSNIP